MSVVILKQIKDVIEDELKPIHKKLDELSTNVDSLILDVADVQKKTDVLPDIHSLIKNTREDVKDHEQRLRILENTA